VTESVAKRPINHRILVPKGGAFQFQYAVKDGHSQEDTITLLRRMVAEYAAASYQVFDVQERSTKRGTEWHVVPVMARDKAGNFAQQTVLLDNLITIPKEKRTAMAVVDEVCRQLSIAWGHKVGVGMVPLNPLYAHQVEFGATNQPARDVLADILGPRMVWQLFYDAGLDWYMLNIHTASLPPPRPPLPSRVYSAGPSAQGSSVSAIPSSPGPRFPTALLIKYKLTPERITEIQAALARRGYYQGQPNGTWDANTIAALQKSQTDNGLEPNGRPRPETLEKLGIGPAPPLFPPKN